MQIVYIILLSLLIPTLFTEGACIFEQRQFFHKYRNTIKSICDVICVLILCGLSIIGCIETVNVNTYFLVIYIAIYFLLKEVYAILITNRREKSIKIKLQSLAEKTFLFNELFICKSSKEEKEKINTWWIRKYSNKDGEEAIGILLNGERYYFVLKLKEYSNSLDYIISQISDYARVIKTKEDLKTLRLAVIQDNDLAKEYGNIFIPHNNIQSIKNPSVYKDTLFNMFMLSGFVVGNSLINLISAWNNISLIEKIFNIVIGGMFTVSFLCGLIVMPFIIYESLKKR